MRERGYTLIELAVVVFLVGLMLFLAVPKIKTALYTENLKKANRMLIGTIRELKIAALQEQVDQVLVLDLNNQVFWSYAVDMTPEKLAERKRQAIPLPSGVKIADVSQVGAEKEMEGEIAIRFYRQGNSQPTVVHLQEGEQYETLVLSPFLATVKVHEGYVDISPIGI